MVSVLIEIQNGLVYTIYKIKLKDDQSDIFTKPLSKTEMLKFAVF